jgi:hypothetical protein
MFLSSNANALRRKSGSWFLSGIGSAHCKSARTQPWQCKWDNRMAATFKPIPNRAVALMARISSGSLLFPDIRPGRTSADARFEITQGTTLSGISNDGRK